MNLDKFKKMMFEKEIVHVHDETKFVNENNYKVNEFDLPDVKHQKDLISLICDIIYEYDKMKSELI